MACARCNNAIARPGEVATKTLVMGTFHFQMSPFPERRRPPSRFAYLSLALPSALSRLALFCLLTRGRALYRPNTLPEVCIQAAARWTTDNGGQGEHINPSPACLAH